MAYDNCIKFDLIAGATFSTNDLYKGVTVNSSGHAVVDTGSTATLPVGTLYSVTATTNGNGVEAVSIGWGPIVKMRLAGSTASVGNTIALSTAGLGIAPTTDAHLFGFIVSGSSGTTGRIVSVVRTMTIGSAP
jgi:hypothetical protein